MKRQGGGNPLQAFLDWRRRRLGLRGLLLYVLALPAGFAAVISLAQGELTPALSSFAACAGIVLAGSLIRRGLREELVQAGRRFTRAPRTPFKPLAALALGLATWVGAYGAVGQGLAVSLVFAAMAVLGMHWSYGVRGPRSTSVDSRSVRPDSHVAEALARAEEQILKIEVAAASVGNQELQDRLGRIARQAWNILGLIAERPDELFRARKFLSVYLEGAQRVASRFVKTHRLARSQVLENNFRNVLIEIEDVFQQQHGKLLQADLVDLDVRIDVLRRQMQREGLA